MGVRTVTYRRPFSQVVVSFALVIASVAAATDAAAQAVFANNSQSATSASSSQSTTAPSGSQPEEVQEVTVTARKQTERLLDVPEAVTVIDAASMLQNNYVGLADYYATVPGLSIVPYGNGQTAIIMRGLSTGTSGNPTVGVSIDDVPVGATETAIINGSAYIPDLDPADLQSVEFLKGPQGTLYGASSIGGEVRYVTAIPDLTSTTGHAEVDGTTIPDHGDGYGVRAGINIPIIPDMLAIRISGFERRDPGYVDNYVEGLSPLKMDNVNGDNVQGGYLAALFQPTKDFSLRLTALVQHSDFYGDSSIDTNYSFQPLMGDLTQSRLLGSGGNIFQTQLYDMTLKYHTDIFDITSISGFGELQLHQNIDETQSLGPLSEIFFDVGGADQRYVNDNTKFTEELRLSSPVGTKLSWEVGGFWTRENNGPGLGQYFANNLDTGIQPVVGLLLNYYFTSKYNEYSEFANFTYHFTDHLDLEVGGRYSHNYQSYYQAVTGALNGPENTLATGANEHATTYLITPRYHFSESLMTYLTVSSGFEPGGPNTPEFPTPSIPTTFAPSRTVNYELGVKSEMLERRLSLDADVFYVDWSNVQLTGIFPVVDTSYTFNGGKAKSEGVEFEADLIPLEGLKLTASTAYTDAVLTNSAGHGFPGVAGDQLPFATRYSGSLSAEERFSINESVTGFVSATAAYVGKRFEGFPASLGEPQPAIPAYGYGDLRTGIDTHGYTITAFVKNLTDERGVLYSTQITGTTLASGLWHTVVIPPRTVGVSVMRSF